jgi:peptidoglycan hydrolase CwlO-like protein
MLKQILTALTIGAVGVSSGFVGGAIYKDKTIDVTQKDEYKQIQTQNVGLTEKLDATKTKLATTLSEKQELETQVATYKQELAEFETKLANCEKNILILQESKTAIETEIEELTTTANANTTAVENANAKLQEIENKLNAEIAQREALTNNITATENALSELKTKIETIETTISTLQTSINDINTKLANVAHKRSGFTYTNEFARIDTLLEEALRGAAYNEDRCATEIVITAEGIRIPKTNFEMKWGYGITKEDKSEDGLYTTSTEYSLFSGIDKVAYDYSGKTFIRISTNTDGYGIYPDISLGENATDYYYLCGDTYWIKISSSGGSSMCLVEIFGSYGDCTYYRIPYIQKMCGQLEICGNITYGYTVGNERE